MKFYIVTLLILFQLSLQASVSPQDLENAVRLKIHHVPELVYIIEQANKLGFKAYLFGGTGAAFGHYVRWDLERQAGDTKYQKERFDYDFTSIYRANQDLDIVIDGTPEQAEALHKLLQETYPHMMGDKGKDGWEVRLLRAQKGDKLPLLNDFDFLNQNTDTNSTGLLALNPESEESIFRDLFHWDLKGSEKLK